MHFFYFRVKLFENSRENLTLISPDSVNKSIFGIGGTYLLYSLYQNCHLDDLKNSKKKFKTRGKNYFEKHAV